MVVAVILVWVMQMVADEVVDVVAVGYRFVSAAGAVLVVRIVPLRGRYGVTVRVLAGHVEFVLVDMILVWMVQVTVVKIIDVVAVLDRLMPATWAVNVVMFLVSFVMAHGASLTDRSLLGKRSRVRSILACPQADLPRFAKKDVPVQARIVFSDFEPVRGVPFVLGRPIGRRTLGRDDPDRVTGFVSGHGDLV